MADLVVGGVTVSVHRDGADNDRVEYGGDRARVESGAMRSSVKGRKYEHHFHTAAALSYANANTLVAAIEASPPVTCSGDILGASGSYVGVVHKRPPVSLLGTTMYHVHFSLLEI